MKTFQLLSLGQVLQLLNFLMLVCVCPAIVLWIEGAYYSVIVMVVEE